MFNLWNLSSGIRSESEKQNLFKISDDVISCGFRLEHLQGDAIAGLTVGLTVIPQGLALAHVAQLPPQVSLVFVFTWELPTAINNCISCSVVAYFTLFLGRIVCWVLVKVACGDHQHRPWSEVSVIGMIFLMKWRCKRVGWKWFGGIWEQQGELCIHWVQLAEGSGWGSKVLLCLCTGTSEKVCS